MNEPRHPHLQAAHRGQDFRTAGDINFPGPLREAEELLLGRAAEAARTGDWKAVEIASTGVLRLNPANDAARKWRAIAEVVLEGLSAPAQLSGRAPAEDGTTGTDTARAPETRLHTAATPATIPDSSLHSFEPSSAKPAQNKARAPGTDISPGLSAASPFQPERRGRDLRLPAISRPSLDLKPGFHSAVRLVRRAALSFEAPTLRVLRRRVMRARTFEFTFMGVVLGASISVAMVIALPDTYPLPLATDVEYGMFIPKVSAFGGVAAFIAAMLFPWRNR